MTNWPMIALDELCLARTGTVDPTKAPDCEFLYIDISSVDVNRKEVIEPRWLLGREAPNRARRSVVSGDVIVSMTRPNLNAVALISPEHSGQVCSTGFCVLRPGVRLLSRFLFHFVQTRRFVDTLTGLVSGALYPAVTEGQVRQQCIPLPPLDEQRRIVDILDRVANIRSLRRQAQETTDQIVPALFSKMFGDPGTNPFGWPTVRMQSLFREGPRYGTMAPATVEPNDYLCIRVANIQNNHLSLDSMKYVSAGSINEQRHLVEEGDLLIARAIASRELLGKCFVAYPGNLKWAFDSHIMMCRFNRALVDPEYVASFLKSPSGRREFLSHTRSSAIQFNINTKEFSTIAMPLPPIELQAEFVRQAKDVRRTVASQSRADALCDFAVQAIQARLFRN